MTRAAITTAALLWVLAPAPFAAAGDGDDTRPWLGVSFTNVTSAHGVFIKEVINDTPAHDAGLEDGDVILSIDGEAVAGGSELSAVIQSKKIGDEIVVHVDRAGQDVVVNVELERFPSPDEILFKRLVGKVASPLDIEIVRGTTRLDELAGRVWLLAMVAPYDDPDSHATQSELSKLATNHTSADLIVLSIANATREALQSWCETADWYHDIARPNDYGTMWSDYISSHNASTPTFYVVDETGVIVFAGIGADRLDEAVLIAERAVRKKKRR